MKIKIKIKMTDKQIEEKALEVYPERHVQMPYCVSTYDVNEDHRDGYKKALNDIESLPKIKGWVARDYIGDYLCFFNNKPVNKDRGRWRDENANTGSIIAKFGEDSFPDLTWESEPIEVELLIRKL